jgi:hypothetical protein
MGATVKAIMIMEALGMEYDRSKQDAVRDIVDGGKTSMRSKAVGICAYLEVETEENVEKVEKILTSGYGS